MTQALSQPVPASGTAQSALAAPGAPLRLARRWDLRQSLMLGLLLASWLAVRPWGGIWHDGRLYAAQALARLHPALFRHDLYFMFGSQDAFTVFSPIYAAFIQAFGLELGAQLLQTLGSLLWLGAALFLMAKFLRGAALWLGAALLLLLPTDYDPTGALALAESFLTPRIFAEALGLLAIACVVRGKARWAVPLLALALLLHPLQTLGVLLFLMLYLANSRRRQLTLALLALAGGAAVLWLGKAGVMPFDRLLQSMDAEWFGYVARISPMVAWDAWSAADNLPGRTAVAASLVLAAGWLAAGWRARFYYCTALSGAIGVAAAWLGTGVFHNLLLIQVQPWRALWLLQLVSVMALCSVWQACWPRGRIFRLLLLALTGGVLLRDGAGAALAAATAAALCWQDRRPAVAQLSDRSYRLLLLGAGMLVLAWLAQVEHQSLQARNVIAWYFGTRESDLERRLWSMLRLGGAAALGLAAGLAVWRLAGQPQRRARLAAGALVAACLLAAGVLGRDYSANRPKISAATSQALQQRFLPLMAPQASVYWHDDVRPTWFLLQRASYYSMTQLSGLAFSRATAMEGMRRRQRLQVLGLGDKLYFREHPDGKGLPGRSLAGLAYVCADPALDFLVLAERIGTAAVAQVAGSGDEPNYYLYDCARQRASRAAP